MTNISIQELVRKDLLWAEQQGTLAEPYTGPEALLDAYETALDLACYLRRVIEDMAVGGQLYRQPRGVQGATSNNASRLDNKVAEK